MTETNKDAGEQPSTNDQVRERSKPNYVLWCCFGGCGCIGFLIIVGLIAIFGLKLVNWQDITNRLDNVGTNNSDNGSSSSDMNKNELIDYFVAETTYHSGMEKTIPLIRWTKSEVSLAITGTPSAEGLGYIDEFISKFNQNSTTVKIVRKDYAVEPKPNILIEWGKNPPSGKPGRAAFVWHDDSCDIYASAVEIGDGAEEEVPGINMLKHVINHELYHTMGFAGHYKSDSCNLMSGKTCGNSFNVNEEKLVKMLYSMDLPLCSTETEIRQFFSDKNI